MEEMPSVSYSMTLWVEFPHEAGSLGPVLTAVGDFGGMLGSVDIVRMRQKVSIRDTTVLLRT